MEFGLLVAVLSIVTIILVNLSKAEVKNLNIMVNILIQEIHSLRKEISTLKDDLTTSPDCKQHAEPDNIQTEEEENIIREPEIPEVSIPALLPEAIEIHEPAQPIFEATTSLEEEPIAAFATPPPQPAPTQQKGYQFEEGPGWYDKWISKNPDLEKFIGENLINKIGIAVLVLGIAFFVKYAIDQNWINETGRVCIGLSCGAILVGVAHYLRNSYRSFSSVLAGGGIAVFYFTIAFAFHQYHLLSQTTSFVIMVVITAFAVALSVLYNKLELAVIASIGGFITPFLVSTGDGNYIVLFTYLIILNIGLLSLAWFKRWPVINIIALFFTEVIYGSWLGVTISDHKPVSYPLALVFASIFYLIFLGMNMINQVRNKENFRRFDFFILLLISASYYAAGMVLLHEWNNGAYQGLFTLSIGLINLLLAYYVYRKGQADRNLLFLLIGLTFSFVTLTIPIQLHGHAITMFWSAEFVLLYWLSTYSGIRIFKYSSALLCVLTFVSLLLDWTKANANSGDTLAIIFSNIQGIVTNAIAIAAFALYFILLKKSGDKEYIFGIPAKQAGGMALALSVALLYITCIFGVDLCYRHLTLYDIPNVYHRLITESFGLVFLYIMQRSNNKISPVLQVITLIACFLFYLSSTTLITNLRDGMLAGNYPWYYLYVHLADSVLLGVLFYKAIQGIRANPGTFETENKVLSIVFTVMIIVFLSIDLLHIYVMIGYHKNNTDALTVQYGKAGLTALWGICSFALMWTGMKNKQKTLRIISLTLFTIVLLKLFILDISGISEGGKIFAFILLGVLLLTVSFMYQKLKKIIIDDHKE